MIIVYLEHYFIPDIFHYILAFLVALLIFNAGGIVSFLNIIKSALAYVGFGLAIWIFFYYSAGIDGIGIDDFKFCCLFRIAVLYEFRYLFSFSPFGINNSK